MHIKDLELLRLIQKFFNVGNIIILARSAYYYVNSIKDLNIIINHFDNYPLISRKQVDFLLFKTAAQLISSKEHLTEKGLLKIVSLRASSNNGLSEKLKSSFPKLPSILIEPPTITSNYRIDGNWLAGFISGDGSFQVSVYKTNTNVGVGVTLWIKIYQDKRDLDLLKSFIAYLGCGSVSQNGETVWKFSVSKFSDICKIISFLDNYPILGTKALDFADFKKVAELITKKAHLSKSGIEKILALKSGMNSGR